MTSERPTMTDDGKPQTADQLLYWAWGLIANAGLPHDREDVHTPEWIAAAHAWHATWHQWRDGQRAATASR